jgi:hypothetical protein
MRSRLDGAGVLVPSDRTGWNLPWVKRYNLTPHVVVGQWHPDHLPAPASAWDASTWAKYEDYAYKYIRYVATEYDGSGFMSSVFEVGNEIDITQHAPDLWTLVDTSVPQGHESRYQHYMRVFRVWSKAVARVAAENPSRSVQIGGPALGGQSLFLTNDFWHERFIRDAARENLRLDIVTHHFYGDIYNGWPNVPGSSLKAQLLRMRAALDANGRAGTPISVSEWGPSEASDQVYGAINYRHESAAWGMAFLTEAVAGTASSGSFLGTRDNFGGDITGAQGFSSFVHKRAGPEYMKPIANAFQMWWMLPGSRKDVATPAGQPNVRAVAASSREAAAMIVYNYNYKFAQTGYFDASNSEPVVPAFTRLEFSGDVLVDRYLIDEQHSNVARYIDAGVQPDAAGSSLQRVEQCYAKVTNGSVVLPARTLAPGAVSLWIVKSKLAKRTAESLGLHACK